VGGGKCARSAENAPNATRKCAPSCTEPQGTEQRTEPFADARSARRRVTARIRTRRTSDRPPPDPRVAGLLDAFVTTHHRILGTKYLVRGARDGAHLKRALSDYDQATIERAIQIYFADVAARTKYPTSVPHFVGRIAALTSPHRLEGTDYRERRISARA